MLLKHIEINVESSVFYIKATKKDLFYHDYD